MASSAKCRSRPNAPAREHLSALCATRTRETLATLIDTSVLKKRQRPLTRQRQFADVAAADPRATVHESERIFERQDGQIPCERPRSSIGTSTNTAAGLLCDAHHAQTVRIGRAAALRSARTPPCRCELRNASRGVMLLFVAMNLTSCLGPRGPIRPRVITHNGKSCALLSSSAAVVIELRIV